MEFLIIEFVKAKDKDEVQYLLIVVLMFVNFFSNSRSVCVEYIPLDTGWDCGGMKYWGINFKRLMP